jgi:hypothetical protein
MKQQMRGIMISCTMIQENKGAQHVTEITAVQLEKTVGFKQVERQDNQVAVVDALLEEQVMWEVVQQIDRLEDVDVQLVV